MENDVQVSLQLFTVPSHEWTISTLLEEPLTQLLRRFTPIRSTTVTDKTYQTVELSRLQNFELRTPNSELVLDVNF
jgi:hypothetical protein